ncbi:DUF1707 domain-containing protein [Streptomyces armeniacus]|uniref:DUF1707 domain-containing protein n=1 Tax=Streptomyces armeniacus TaxID=83291 RepID=A0A345XQR7_9ACTN|nr:DUF1707 domain-containing protein [Streptomyces armeniacus]AXK33983.1 DUF1707 domain-containing protein [Streptomyces armeniacus]
MPAEQPPPGDDPVSRLAPRASHSDREAVVERLQEAAAEGRLDMAELDERVERALTAKTHADLAPLTADLPVPEVPAPAEPLVLKGGMQGVSRTGRWNVPSHITVRGGMGGAALDFTRTECRLSDVEIDVNGEMAGVTIVIPDEWAADVTGADPGIGNVKDRTTPERAPGTPLIRLTGTGGMAGVTIRHPNRWERRKLRKNPPR